MTNETHFTIHPWVSLKDKLPEPGRQVWYAFAHGRFPRLTVSDGFDYEGGDRGYWKYLDMPTPPTGDDYG